jgi:type II secretion system protein I
MIHLHKVAYRPNNSLARGFTLIEVLVALTIVAVSLMAGMKASGALTLHAQRQTDGLLGQMCVENALHQIRHRPIQLRRLVQYCQNQRTNGDHS